MHRPGMPEKKNPYITAVLLAFTADQLCKREAERNLPLQKSVPLSFAPADKVSLQHVKNKGFALNRLDKYPALIRLTSAAVCAATGVGFAKALQKKEDPFTKMGLALSFGGGLSNTLDRVVKQEVTDYLAVRHGEKAVVYNLADFSLFAGMVLIGAGAVWKSRKQNNRE